MQKQDRLSRVVLPSGLRVIVESVPGARSVSIGVWVEIGSRHDPQGMEGAAHFVEHLLFKGTRRRTARQISEELDYVGGSLNAFTAKEHTCLYARVLGEDFGLAADVLCDMVKHSLFREQDTELERNVILEEINTYEDAPDEVVLDLLESLIWQEHSMGKPILGTSSAVSLMKNSDLKEFYAKAYGSRRVVVAAAGNVSAERVVDEMGVLLDGLGGGDLPDAVLPVPSTEPRAGTRAKQVEQVHMCLGAVGLRADDPRQYSLHVLNNILGGGPSSRLFQIIREERGLAYSVYSFHSSFKDTGVFGVYSAANPEYAASVKQLVMDEMSDIAAKHVSDEELERAKRQLKGSLLLGFESMSSRMMRLGRSELLVGRVVPVDEVTRKIEAVTHDDVLSLAKELLHPAGLSLALVGADPVHTRRIARGG